MTACPKCNGTGRLPFVKNGWVVPYTWRYCDCHREEPERYQSYSPDAIDFPCSWDFHRHYQVECGLPDPGPEIYKPPIAEAKDPRYDTLEGEVLELRRHIRYLEQRAKTPTREDKQPQSKPTTRRGFNG